MARMYSSIVIARRLGLIWEADHHLGQENSRRNKVHGLNTTSEST